MRNTKRSYSLSVLVIVLFASVAISADWNQWRGPDRDDLSKETGLLKEWPESGPSLVWKATGLGTGFSGISISSNRIFTMGDEGSDCYARAYSLTDGKHLWSTKIGKAGGPGWGNFKGPRSTPTVDGEMVYVIGQYGEILCLKASDGSIVWAKHLQEDLGGKRPEWGFSESVLIDNEKVLCTPGGSKGAIIALNKKTGEIIWRTKDFKDGAHYSSLVCCEIAGVKQYVQLTADSVVGIATDGNVLWRAKRKGKTAVIPTPIVKDNKVYVTSGYGVGCNLFEIRKSDGKFSADELYSNKTIANHHGGAILVGDHIYSYCDAKGWTCQQFDTGQIKWTEKGQVGKGSLTYADGHLYLRAESNGTVGLIEATTEGYKEKGRFKQPGFGRPKTWPHPVIANGKLYLRDQDILLCYDVSD
jgi:outer membrane protein assembly factor BamB